MAYVVPSGVIQLFRGINLDNRYMHTIYFADETAQNTWFSSKVTYNFTSQMKTRHNGNTIKLKVACETIADCTYLRFQNSPNTKWYYAFIIGVNYINENVTEIIYEIDVMQTWFIQNGSIKPCMVLREHVNDDSFGEHLEAEPVNSDVYKMDLITQTDLFTKLDIVINCTPKSAAEYVASDIVNNDIYNPTQYVSLNYRDSAGNIDVNALWNQTQALIYTLLGSWDINEQSSAVIDAFIFPTEYGSKDKTDNIHATSVTMPSTMGSYTPKNNKLLTYPYCYLGGTTKDGDTAMYRWEYFTSIGSTGIAVFKSYGLPVAGGHIICFPHTYNGVVDNMDCKMTMDNFPKVPLVFDAYQAWAANGGKTKLEYQKLYTDVKAATAVVSGTSQMVNEYAKSVFSVGNAVETMADQNDPTPYMQSISQGVSEINRSVQSTTQFINKVVDIAEAKNKIAFTFKDAVYKPNMVVGSATPCTSIPLNELDFFFFNVHVEEHEAKKLDDFLSVYGYAVNRVKAPNITGRKYWNFVQTQDCIIDGNMPASSKEAIARIFDGGIFFWNNGDNIGNFSIETSQGTIDNPIL